MFTPKYIEEGRALAKAARKVINYRRDVARPEDIERVRQHLAGLKEALKVRSSEAVEKAEKDLLPSLGKLQPLRELSGVRENVELIVVAIVLALGIRAYYLQPFKIPTGSMQPTLNGVIGHRTEAPPPNIFVRAFQFVTLGRTYEDVVCEEPTDSIESISPAKVNRLSAVMRISVINSLSTSSAITSLDRIEETFSFSGPTESSGFLRDRILRVNTISSVWLACRVTLCGFNSPTCS
jgi:hypothetical protein